MELSAPSLRAACADDADDAGITIGTTLEPLAGPGSAVKPAGYPERMFQEDERWWGDPLQPTRAIVIDNTPSQANRLEASLERLATELGLPAVVMDLSGISTLPPHLPRQLSGFQFPHRNADAYLRDALLDGTKFADTAIGAAVFNATAANPRGVLDWFPQALLFGFWQSHLGNKRSKAKLARSWTSEVVGYAPATGSGDRTRTLATKGDELGLTASDRVEYNKEDQLEQPWQLVTGVKREKPVAGASPDKLSAIGHGQIITKPADAALGPVSFRAIEQTSTVSFAGLRRLPFGDAAASATARALIVALGLVAHVDAFGRSFRLRSGCDLRPVTSKWTWVAARESGELTPPDGASAIKLFKECRAAAAECGLLGEGWGDQPLRLTPAPELVKAITATWPLEPIAG